MKVIRMKKQKQNTIKMEGQKIFKKFLKKVGKVGMYKGI